MLQNISVCTVSGWGTVTRARAAAERGPAHQPGVGRTTIAHARLWSALTDVRSPKNVPLDPVRRQVGDGGHAGALPVDSRVRHSVELGQSRVAWASHAAAACLAGIQKKDDLSRVNPFRSDLFVRNGSTRISND